MAKFTWSHTVGTGADRILVVCVQFRNVSSETITGVTYAGVAMTKTDGSSTNMTVANSDNIRSEIWTLANPNAGANNIVVTFSAAVRGVGEASSWTGVDQTTPLGTYASATGSSTTPSVAVSSASGDVVVDSMGAKSLLVLSSVTAGQTLLISKIMGLQAGGTQQAAGTGSNVTMSWTLSASSPWAIGGVTLKAASATGGTTSATGVQISEISIQPLRNGAQGFSVQGSAGRLENQQAAWEASGMYAKVLRFKVENGQWIWDDIYTLSSVAPAGKIAISTLPTQQSPTGSLLVTTQDSIYQYPLANIPDPATATYPVLSASSSVRGSDLVPIYYASAWDGGDTLYELAYVHIRCKNIVQNTDTVQMMYRWDDTFQWEYLSTASSSQQTVFRLQQNDCLFEIPRGNIGSTLHLAFNVNDGASTDPVGPEILAVICWLRELETTPGTQAMPPARATLEVS